jgi:hypothetical protein
MCPRISGVRSTTGGGVGGVHTSKERSGLGERGADPRSRRVAPKLPRATAPRTHTPSKIRLARITAMPLNSEALGHLERGVAGDRGVWGRSRRRRRLVRAGALGCVSLSAAGARLVGAAGAGEVSRACAAGAGVAGAGAFAAAATVVSGAGTGGTAGAAALLGSGSDCADASGATVRRSGAGDSTSCGSGGAESRLGVVFDEGAGGHPGRLQRKWRSRGGVPPPHKA